MKMCLLIVLVELSDTQIESRNTNHDLSSLSFTACRNPGTEYCIFLRADSSLEDKRGYASVSVHSQKTRIFRYLNITQNGTKYTK